MEDYLPINIAEERVFKDKSICIHVKSAAMDSVLFDFLLQKPEPGS
jgi:hypothetical protein